MTHGKIYNKSPRRINHKATKSKTNTGTTALERSVEQTTGGFKALLQLANFTLGPDATLNTEIHTNSVRLKAPNSVNASKRKHKNQINHYNKQRRVLMANSTVCQSKWKPIVEPITSITFWALMSDPGPYWPSCGRFLDFFTDSSVILSKKSVSKHYVYVIRSLTGLRSCLNSFLVCSILFSISGAVIYQVQKYVYSNRNLRCLFEPAF